MSTPPRPDRDAILDALQDQIDDLTAAVATQQKLIDAHGSLIVELARLAGLGDARPHLRRAMPPHPEPPAGGRDG